MSIRLVQVNSLEDINQNFAAIAQALSNITGEQIVGGSIGSAAIGGDVVPRSGGSYTGDISAPNITASGALNGNTMNVASTAQVGALHATGLVKSSGKNCVVADQVATEAALGLVKLLGNIPTFGISASDPPTQAQVQAIIDKFNVLLGALVTRQHMAAP